MTSGDLTPSQVLQDVVQVLADDQDSLVCRLEGLLGELGHVRLQEGVEDVRKGLSSLLLQVLLCCQPPLRLPLDHLSHLRTDGHGGNHDDRHQQAWSTTLN